MYLLAAKTAAGCADTVSHLLRIDPLPNVDAGFDSVICRGQTTVLHASGAAYYNWLSNTSLSCTDCASPAANPSYNTTYFLTGKNIYGCINTDSVNIQVKQPAHVLIMAPDTICAGNTIHLRASGAELYNWQPSTLVANNTDSVTTSTPSSTTTYSVIGKDTKGCFRDTASATVNVYPYPTVKLTDSTITIEAGNSYQINALGSEDIDFWQWTPLINITCSNCAQPIVKPTATQTYTVTASNVAGCSVAKKHYDYCFMQRRKPFYSEYIFAKR